MKIFIVVSLAIALLFGAGCEFRYDVPEYTGPHPMSVYIQSDSVFSVSGNLYLATMQDLPVTIYNPNSQPIIVFVDTVEFIIPSHESLTIRSSDKPKRTCSSPCLTRCLELGIDADVVSQRKSARTGGFDITKST